MLNSGPAGTVQPRNLGRDLSRSVTQSSCNGAKEKGPVNVQKDLIGRKGHLVRLQIAREISHTVQMFLFSLDQNALFSYGQRRTDRHFIHLILATIHKGLDISSCFVPLLTTAFCCDVGDFRNVSLCPLFVLICLNQCGLF